MSMSEEKRIANQADLELVEKARSGDNESLEVLVKKYKALVCQVVRSKFFLISGGDSDDLIQEGTIGFIQAVREYRDDKAKGTFAGFAALCIKNRVADAVKSFSSDKHKPLNTAATTVATGENEDESLLDNIGDDSALDPVSAYIDEEERSQFYDKIATILSEKQQKILKLYLQGYSYKEIASKLNLSSKSVDNALLMSKEKIKKAKTNFIS